MDVDKLAAKPSGHAENDQPNAGEDLGHAGVEPVLRPYPETDGKEHHSSHHQSHVHGAPSFDQGVREAGIVDQARYGGEKCAYHASSQRIEGHRAPDHSSPLHGMDE